MLKEHAKMLHSHMEMLQRDAGVLNLGAGAGPKRTGLLEAYLGPGSDEIVCVT